jgi:lycopene beta-cyclase
MVDPIIKDSKHNNILSEFRQYDYIISGAGCAGLSLLVRMIQSGRFSDKKILLVDKDLKTKNDRTWCFWEKGAGLFEPVVFKRWNKAWFRSQDFSRLLQITPYSYKLIRGSDFYAWCMALIRKHANIDVRLHTVETVGTDDESAYIITNGQRINATYVFNSIIFEQPVLKKKQFYLLQHFKGWIIETEKSMFNPDEAILMDFRVNQKYGTTFAYMMPFSATNALVEYTLFSREVLTQQQYDTELQEYLSSFLDIDNYTILETEHGLIPMTNHRFPASENKVINIGTAGGQTKASSGYTFQFIQKHSDAIVKQMITTGNPLITPSFAKRRFDFYDSVLLNILYNDSVPGSKIFAALFKKNTPQQVLRFLDNESSLTDELSIVSSLPTGPFLKAALQQI